MSARAFLDGRVTLHSGDCLDVLATLPEASVDSVVCDPPYHLTSVVKRFGAEDAAACKVGKTGAYARASAGFMGKKWDGGDVAFRVETWEAVLRVLKPGGHLVAFGGTRTYHRLACAIEDSGFECRDAIMWHYGSGFPKSHDVSKGIDRAAGAEREKIAIGAAVKRMIPGADQNGEGSWIKDNGRVYQPGIELPATEAAKQWEGWGTALKPATEIIVLARKPLIGTVAANVLQFGTGAINVDGCRIETGDDLNGGAYSNNREISTNEVYGEFRRMEPENYTQPVGRWPANLIHDGSEEVLAAFPDSESGIAVTRNGGGRRIGYGTIYGGSKSHDGLPDSGYTDAGSAARFFYTAKADSEDRLGSKHPTVKPLDLMQWLVRLVTPKGGTCLDPFAGTGTTGEAAWREGMNTILIEREEEYQADIVRRMDLATQPTKRAAVAKTKNKLDDPKDLPLFAEPAQ